MKLDVMNMKGRIPRIYDRNLPNENATIAENTDLRSGALRPYLGREDVLELTADNGFDPGSIYRWDSGAEQYWLRFPGDIDVVRGPVADDVWQRIYWTGDPDNPAPYNEPRMSYAGKIEGEGLDDSVDQPYPINTYRIGVPAPEQFPDVTVAGSKSGTVKSVYFQDAFIVEVDSASGHGLSTGDLVELNVTGDTIETDDDDNPTEQDIEERLNNTQHQIEVVSDAEFKLQNTESDAGIDYNTVTGGTWSQYTGADFRITRRYAFTYVNELGEEGPPQNDLASQDPTDASPFLEVTLTLPTPVADVTDGRVITKRNIYRVATGQQSAQFQFLKQLDVTESEFVDTNDELEETIESVAFDPPNDRMQGLCIAPQGFAVGFYDNVVAISEPNRPHAWPTDYQLALDWPVVAVEIIDAGIVVATTGQPYLIQGVDPRSMTPRQLWLKEACVSKRSMVSLGYAAIYASANGLVMVSNDGAQLVTLGIVTEREWADFQPETMHGAEVNGQYIAFYGDSVDGKGLLFDPRQKDRGFVDLGFWCQDTYRDSTESYLYMLMGDDTIQRWDAGTPEPYRWRSKRYTMPFPINLGAAKITADSDPVTFRLFSEGELVYEIADCPINKPFPLPSGYTSREYQFEVQTTATMQRIEVAESMQEIDVG